MQILLTRPHLKNASLQRQLSALGFEVLVEPLLTFYDIDTPPLPLDTAGFILTSQRAIPRLATLWHRRDTPIYVVGSTTQRLAEAAGFSHVLMPPTREESVRSLKQYLRANVPPDCGRLIYLSGEDITDPLADLTPPLQIERRIVYGTLPAEAFSIETIEAFHAPLWVTLFSRRTAQIFLHLLQQLSFEPQALSYVCLSPAIAAVCYQQGYSRVITPPAPTVAALLTYFQTVADTSALNPSGRNIC
jgi:uroporphyrinogen-III synthase